MKRILLAGAALAALAGPAAEARTAEWRYRMYRNPMTDIRVHTWSLDSMPEATRTEHQPRLFVSCVEGGGEADVRVWVDFGGPVPRNPIAQEWRIDDDFPRSMMFDTFEGGRAVLIGRSEAFEALARAQRRTGVMVRDLPGAVASAEFDLTKFRATVLPISRDCRALGGPWPE